MKIAKGDVVTIEAQGITVKAEVLSADNWGTETEPNWYIEMKDYYIGYRYWKQEYDGGRLVEVNGEKIEY